MTTTFDARVGPTGHVLATDISPKILDHTAMAATDAGLTDITTVELDGESLDLDESGFDAVISRVELTYFPDQQAAEVGEALARFDGPDGFAGPCEMLVVISATR